MTEEAWVVQRPRLDGPIHLADYDPGWPGLFAREEARIRSVLGERVRRLEHVGSTSVPGLPAKPIIDILLVLDDTSNEAGYVPELEAAGYLLVIREPEWHEHRVFKGPDTNVNLHTFPVGSGEIDRMLGFRDWLRGHDDDRDRYLRTKRELAARTWAYVQDYADAKSEVVESIIARAAVGGLLARMRDDWNRGDLDALMTAYLDDVFVHLAGVAPGEGRDALLAASRPVLAAGTRLESLEPTRIEVAGEVAWVRARYATGGRTGWLLAVVRRSGGEWRVAAESWTPD